ncbi:MBL fold metallo-hydrolase [Actinocorallia sp. API 0066]|uniref:MBL fold metallo-hydrolase n=1 Tax=Actinocorallia sp. API 0066 TaxID=2896846 RepID=UPI001E4B9977|nr:MBL fold metallo-hydrolase [Actinocorallia sp. API 0066]MCD0451392.1 MBL fold metallo-hydrolase [Actinocorallia sp. API 0066]
MRVTVIGCSGSFPGPDSPASCYLFEDEGFSLLLDFGNGALGALQRHHDLYGVDAIAISHLHADHCMDLCGYYVARKYCPSGTKPKIPVYGPPNSAMRMAEAYDLELDPGMTDTFDFVPLAPTITAGPFEISVRPVNHVIESYGFRVTSRGKTVAYSGDTGRTDVLVDLARDADLFLCEASFLDGDNPPDLHLSAREAAEYADRAGVGRLVLTHLVPWNDAERSMVEAKDGKYSGPIDLARSGAVYRL